MANLQRIVLSNDAPVSMLMTEMVLLLPRMSILQALLLPMTVNSFSSRSSNGKLVQSHAKQKFARLRKIMHRQKKVYRPRDSLSFSMLIREYTAVGPVWTVRYLCASSRVLRSV